MNAYNGQGRDTGLLLTLNFKDSTVMLNEGILDVLGRPRQVQVMLNEEMKRLLMRPCELDSAQAVVIPAEHVIQVEIGARSLLRRIRRIAGWDTEKPRICIGSLIPDYQAVCFELDDAIAVDVPGPASPDNGYGTHSPDRMNQGD